MGLIRLTCRTALPTVGLICTIFLAFQPDVSAGEASAYCNHAAVGTVRPKAIGPPMAGIAATARERRLRPSQTLYARLMNRGSERANYGPEFRIERLEGSKWVLDPASPRGPWLKKIYTLKAGMFSRCFRWSVPSEQPMGTYRFIAFVKVNGKRSRRTVEFFVQ